MKTKEELKLYFEKGDKPTQEQFWQWMDSYWHKEEVVERVIPLVTDGILIGHGLSISTPKDVKKIKQGAFQFTGVTYQINEASFNEGLEEIGGYVFQGQNVKKIKTPSTLKTIETGAFVDQGDIIFASTSSLEEIILNEGLITIGDYAFKCLRAKLLHNLYIPNSVQTVGQEAFNIPSLQTVSASSGLDLSNAGIPSTAVITYR
ncbi:hypothetical protein J3D55_003396 [Chryseobacterium ginsenosidimutans]|uniref:leucine-rich repeat domain-containing protein n=1 Tax=Chryseobacterium ginsenosidimutans TaxID=687846 RepID=UPI002168656A|nr:leucine-rich repeat domain-containing protein [Chryseobacterium ginsenosidimutans]MCS3870480.1 hypothetical protein [Chryseobacterium ginsenosidimutans]